MAALAIPTALGARGEISTVAGTGAEGYNGDGIAAKAAELDIPVSLAALPDGGFLIADAGNHRIRRVSPRGTITTVAGTGASGFSGDGGPASAAQLFDPQGVAAIPGGGLLIADTINNRIRRVSAGGVISTVAGTAGAAGYNGDGIDATTAKLDNPRGVARLPDGSLLIADTNNHRIRRVSPGGIISTVAGTGTAGYSGDGAAATAGQINAPRSVAALPDGGFLIADTDNHRIRRVSPGGTISTVAGTGAFGFSGDGGAASAAQLYFPGGISVLPSRGFLIAESSNHRVRRVSPGGTISTVAGTGVEGFNGDGIAATAAHLRNPTAAVPLPDGGFLLADADNNRVRRVQGAPPPRACGGRATWVILGTAAAERLRGTVLADAISGRGRPDRIFGRARGDCLLGEAGDDLIFGQAGRDLLTGGAGNDRLFGQRGRDVLRGGARRDRLYAGPGRDLLVGGPGADLLVGGRGRDVFRCGPGRDTVRRVRSADRLSPTC